MPTNSSHQSHSEQQGITYVLEGTANYQRNMTHTVSTGINDGLGSGDVTGIIDTNQDNINIQAFGSSEANDELSPLGPQIEMEGKLKSNVSDIQTEGKQRSTAM